MIERWRGQATRPRAHAERQPEDVKSPALAPADQAPSAPALDPNRFKLLKRPLDQRSLTAAWDKTAEPPHQ